MQGQQIVIRIVEMQWMGVQKVWKYRYEVASEDSPFHGNLDWIFSKHYMRDGHLYRVEVNDKTGNPEIVTVLEELPKTA